jgi:hypothetical protein
VSSHLEELPPFEHEEPSETIAPTTVLDALKAQRARVATETTYDAPVPGWGGLLVLRMGGITSEQQRRIIERSQKPGGSLQSANVDLVLAAFKRVLGRAKPDDELTVLADDDDLPMGLDERLASALDLGTVRSARDVLFALFSRANSPVMAISAVGGDWLEWARESSDEVDEAFLGE